MISVIIPTYNGEKKIPNILHALAAQTVDTFEVIVVVDGSTDQTVELLNTLQPQLPFSLTVVTQENSGRGGVRNTGVAHAKHELLLFLDDDIRPTPTVIAQHLVHHQQFPSSILTGSTLEDETQCKTDFQRYRRFLTDKWMAPFNQSFPTRAAENHLFMSAAHCSMLRADFDRVGGFQASLTDGEDADFAQRASQLHYAFYVNMHIIAYHDDYPSCATFIARQKNYARAAAVKKSGKTALFLTVAKWPLWIWLVDHTLVFRIFPKKMRYRIYDAIVLAHVSSVMT